YDAGLKGGNERGRPAVSGGGPGRAAGGQRTAAAAAWRSARTWAAGSAAPYTAVPATSTSAPARTAWGAVVKSMPPSTWIHGLSPRSRQKRRRAATFS